MKKDLRNKLILTTVICLLPILVGIVLWDRLPDVMATHFDMEGNPNGWSSKAFTGFGIPVFITAVHLICSLVTEKDPKRQKYPEKMMNLIYWICPVVSWLCVCGTYGYELGLDQKKMLGFVYLFLGLVFIVVGNYMPKVKQNYFLGIKLPWTYASEDNWNKTHRMAGKLWVAGGIVFLLNFFLRIQWLEVIIMFAMILIPVIYSYLYYRKEQKEGSES